MPSGPVTGTKITVEYAALVGRDAYFWAWPLVNVYNRRLTYQKLSDIVLAGPVPAAPLNQLGMLTNCIAATEDYSSHLPVPVAEHLNREAIVGIREKRNAARAKALLRRQPCQ